MIKNVLTHIGGVGIYGLISMSLFFAVFVGTLVWVLRLKKPYLNSMEALPLDDGTSGPSALDTTSNPESRHE